MQEQFLKFIAEILKVDPSSLSLNSSMKEGDWNSLQRLRIVLEIAEEYGVDIPIEEVGAIQTLGDFYRYVETTR